jgi:hypothetical protein
MLLLALASSHRCGELIAPPSTTTKLAPREMAGMALTIEKAST